MNPAVVLFILRLISAALLLAFIGLIGYFLYQDLKLAAAARQAGPSVRGRLVVVESASAASEAGDSFSLWPITTIGRSAGNSLLFDDEFTSARHALLSWRGQHWWLEDLGSRNGTQLNGLPVDGAVVVAPGDVITVGRVRLKMEY
ncbi:MAG: FHA domain-containing protein [Candidatus Promineifilaceae bacterium]